MGVYEGLILDQMIQNSLLKKIAWWTQMIWKFNGKQIFPNILENDSLIGNVYPSIAW